MAYSTNYTCDRCKIKSETVNRHCALPQDWNTVMISNVIVAELCNVCVESLKLFLKGESQ